MNNYYIYTHIRNDTNEIFYVGKGKDKRAYTKSNRSTHWKRIVYKAGYRIEILLDNLDEAQAHKFEQFWIAVYGRVDTTEYGILINYTDGGEGSSGRPMNDYTKKVLSVSNKNRVISDASREHARNLFKGKSGALHNRSKSIVCRETKEIFGCMSEAARYYNISVSSISYAIKKNKSTHDKHFEIGI